MTWKQLNFYLYKGLHCFWKKYILNYFIVEHAVAHNYLINANGDRKNGLDNAYFNKIGEFINKRT